jgi:hypothetical protein
MSLKKSIVSDFCVDGEACGGNQRYIFLMAFS